MSLLQSAKLVAMEATSLSKDALHVYVGLAVMLAAVILLKKSFRDWQPLAVVLLAALAGEIWDVLDTFAHGGTPRFSVDWMGVLNMMFWPIVLFLLARFTRLLKR